MQLRRTLALLLSFAATGLAAQSTKADLSATYKDASQKIIAAALADADGYAHLTYLCHHIGHRLSGAPQLDVAEDWAVELMKSAGLENVRKEPAFVPRWVRGEESAEVTAPVARKLHMLGLGGSVGGDVTADAVVVSGFDELAKLGADKVRGKIVVYDEPWKGYGETVMYRVVGASQAAKLGAVAALVRSATGLAMQTPHTGVMHYLPDAPKIPVAAISPEDAELLASLYRDGSPLKVHVKMSARVEADAPSANIVGEIRGSEKPDEIVDIGGHIDSWDVGEGAQDDGAGVMTTFEAVALLHKLGLRPRRTIRIVFWVNEENGARGGKAYRAAIGDKLANHVAAIESDMGVEELKGFSYGRSYGKGEESSAEVAKSYELLGQIAKLLAPIGADKLRHGGGGVDIGPMTVEAVPSLSPWSSGEHYFDWHHTEADTLDKVKPADFQKHVAALAVYAYVLADMPERLAGEKGVEE